MLTILQSAGNIKLWWQVLENVWSGSKAREKRAINRTACEANIHLWRQARGACDLASTGGGGRVDTGGWTGSLAGMCEKRVTYLAQARLYVLCLVSR